MKEYMVVISGVEGIHPQMAYFFDTEKECEKCQLDYPLDNGETYKRTLSGYEKKWSW